MTLGSTSVSVRWALVWLLCLALEAPYEGHRGGVCYVYMYSATDGGFQNMLTTRSTVSKNVLLDSFTVGPLIALPKP